MADDPPVLNYSRPAEPEPRVTPGARILCAVVAVPITLAAAALFAAGVMDAIDLGMWGHVALSLPALALAVLLWRGAGWVKFRR